MARTLVNTIKDSNPVGTTIDSMLTEAQFQLENGNEWVLADGRSVTGSKYETITGNASIPDFRGQFKRGKNNGRSDGQQDPDGERVLGNQVSDKFGSHNHNANIGANGGGGSTGVTGANGGIVIVASTTNSIANNGDNETAPKNITVNIFIKIN